MSKTVRVVENILSANDRIAARNRGLLDKSKVVAVNIMASPGAGKTSTILATFERLKQDGIRLGIIEGDLASSIDADKAIAQGIPAVQINTGCCCHLESHEMQEALDQMPLDEIDLLVVENVGNLVCPTWWNLGEHLRVLIASVPEGDDKPYKYPVMYKGVDAVIINKTDLLPYIDFNMDYFKEGVEILNPGLVTFPISAKTGEGMDAWVEWLKTAIAETHEAGTPASAD
ncbi:MAG: hydrogenase nickel incorporation protein HypB [Chloroflexi bacterium]|nr:hydrogenase nickel incorporation protein HypB [Chloroflexota bacterium]